jgi:hypothetical protein
VGDGDAIRVDYQGKSFTFTKVTAPEEEARASQAGA